MTWREEKAMQIAIAKCSKTAGMLNNEMIKAVAEAVLEGMQWQAEQCANSVKMKVELRSGGIGSLVGERIPYETIDKDSILDAGTESSI